MDQSEYEFTLFDRIEKIKAINDQYDLLHNAYISFSGGKDSTVLSELIDIALPNNKIPRLFMNTGIEYNFIRDYVLDKAKNDDRFIILSPSTNIKKMLEKEGYPFKSKQHSHNVLDYQNHAKVIDECLKEIQKDKTLLDNYEYIKNLPTGASAIVKYIYGVRVISKEKMKRVGALDEREREREREPYLQVYIVSLTSYYISLQTVSI